LNASTATISSLSSEDAVSEITRRGKTVSEYLENASMELKDLFEALKEFITGLGDDIQIKTLKNYIAFRRFKNFACVEIHNRNRHLTIFVDVDPDVVTLEEGFTRDVREVGHFGTGKLEIIIKGNNDLIRAKALIEKSYDTS
jgi:predicted transport protein